MQLEINDDKLSTAPHKPTNQNHRKGGPNEQNCGTLCPFGLADNIHG